MRYFKIPKEQYQKKENLVFVYLGLAVIIALLSGIFLSNGYSLVEGTHSGAVDVFIQDQHTEIIDLKLTRFLDNVTLLDNYQINDIKINISTTGVAPVIGNSICLKENLAFFQADIVAVTSLGGNNYEITLDSPLDYPYTTAGGCSLRDPNWARDGSTTELYYTVSPFGLYENTSWDITRVILVCLGDGVSGPDDQPDMSSFFTTDPLTNGIVFRVKDGFTKNIFTVRDNFHLVSETYDLSIYPKSRFGFYSVTSRRTFNGQDKNGVTIRLNADTDDTFQLIIRDDLTDMEECHAVVQGHVVD